MGKRKVVLYGEEEVGRLIHVVREESRTTSLLVAEIFGKRHDHVLRDIEKLECSDGFRLLNFGESSYLNEQNKTQPMYEMTRDGFSFLAMGFTGKKAAAWKEKYIYCFNRMEQEIRRLADADRITRRIEGKVVRRELTDAIAALEEYARRQNPEHSSAYYVKFSNAVNKSLFILEQGKMAKNFRDLLDGIQLLHVGSAESIIIKVIHDEMAKETDYHTIYFLAKDKVNAFGEEIGQTPPGNHKALRPSPIALEA